MPQTKFQDFIYTVMMVVVMVYAMVFYNIAMDAGLSNEVFLEALCEMAPMCAIAFVLEFFAVGRLAQRIVGRRLDARTTPPLLYVCAVSSVIVCFMCPAMSFIASLLYGFEGVSMMAVNFLRIFVRNFPMALCWQIFYAGPLVRFLFRLLFCRAKKRGKAAEKEAEASVDKSERV